VELTRDVQDQIRSVRGDHGKDRDAPGEDGSRDVDMQEEIDLAVLQIKSETLSRINAALRRLEQGNYGKCFECSSEIAAVRLRALPFAVRCRPCEEARETTVAPMKPRDPSAPFFGVPD
jgi:DnaK suppressor protein